MKNWRKPQTQAEKDAEVLERNKDRPCPSCGASDLGDVIPTQANKDECYGPQGIRWRKHIGLSALEWDRCVGSRCWSCGHQWGAQLELYLQEFPNAFGDQTPRL